MARVYYPPDNNKPAQNKQESGPKEKKSTGAQGERKKHEDAGK